jgi:signal transduction histidine kinase
MLTGTKKFVLIALFTGILIVLVNLAWWIYYQRTEELLDSQLSRRLSAVAAAGSIMIDPLQVEFILAGDLDTYAEVTALLTELQQTDSLAEMFILDENYRYLSTTTIEADSTYFLFSLNGQYVDSVLFFLTERPVLTPTYQTGDLSLKTAFSPLYNSDGYVVAVLGAEANVDYYDVLLELRRNLLYATGLSLIGGLVLGIFFLMLQRRINTAEQQLFLGQTHEYLGRMVAVVSHELKNPLTIIRASAERLEEKTRAPEARYVTEEVDRLNSIVTGYLEFARADGKLLGSDAREEFDLCQLVGGIKRHFHDMYRSEEITWLTEPKPDAITMAGYPRSLRQVLLNLLINGAEACQGSGKVIAVGLLAEKAADEIKLVVIDHGPGFTKNEARNAFTPFYTTKQKGSGLGLYLSKKIVVEMGGSIEISSTKGEKTEMIIILPKRPKS